LAISSSGTKNVSYGLTNLAHGHAHSDFPAHAQKRFRPSLELTRIGTGLRRFSLHDVSDIAEAFFLSLFELLKFR
jgi:hypothetical protein